MLDGNPLQLGQRAHAKLGLELNAGVGNGSLMPCDTSFKRTLLREEQRTSQARDCPHALPRIIFANCIGLISLKAGTDLFCWRLSSC